MMLSTCACTDVERRGRLVADEELRLAWPARARSRCAGAGRRRTGAETSAHPPRPGPPIAAARRRAPRPPPCPAQPVLAQRLGDDVQHLPARVEAGIGILEDHLHAPAAHARRTPAASARPRRSNATGAARRRIQADQQPRHRATCRSPIRRPAPACGRADLEAHAVDGMHELAAACPPPRLSQGDDTSKVDVPDRAPRPSARAGAPAPPCGADAADDQPAGGARRAARHQLGRSRGNARRPAGSAG